MLRRIKTPFKKRSENSDLKYLQFTPVYNYEENGVDDRDDGSSISSVSTNATMDNNPGTGRIMDKFLYQFFGRKLERAIFRMSMTNLSPDRIIQYLWMDYGHPFLIITHLPLGEIIQVFRGSGQIAGLKSLVKQTQSKSLYRSAAALSVLTRLSTSSTSYATFYAAVAAVEPIFHLESLANDFDDSHPEKKYFLILIAIARARLHFVDHDHAPKNTKKFAIEYRCRFLEILDSSRLDPLAVISDVCLLFANVSFSINSLAARCYSLSPVVHSLIETAYFLLTFLVRFLIDQYQTIHNMHPLQSLILSTFFSWLENAMHYILSCMENRWHLPQLLPMCVFSTLHLTISNMRLGVISPRRIPRLGRQSLVSVFPRRIRNSTAQANIPIILRSSLSICTIRTRRLLASPDELRRETEDSIKLKYGSLSDELYDLPTEEKSDEEWQCSLDRARSIPVVENDLTREFLRARKNGLYSFHWSWKYIKSLQRKRHRMGEYCRSNLDWDWDPSSSLKRLFGIEKPKAYSHPEAAAQEVFTALPATIHRESNKDTSEVNIIGKGSNLLQKVRIRYETETGEVKYKTFYAGPSVEDVASGAGADPKTRPSSAQETGWLTGAPNEADKDPEACSRDGMKIEKVADEVEEEMRRSRNVNADNTGDVNASVYSMDRTQCEGGIDEVRTETPKFDQISICSLD